MRQYIKQLLITLLVSGLCFSSLAQAAEREGVIRGLDLKNNKVNIGVASYPLSPTLRIRNLAGGGSSLSTLALQQHVRIITNKKGVITDIWIYPSQPEKRWRLGYGLKDRDQ